MVLDNPSQSIDFEILNPRTNETLFRYNVYFHHIKVEVRWNDGTWKKKGAMTLFAFDCTNHSFYSCPPLSQKAYGFSDPQIQSLCLFTFLEHDSSLIKKEDTFKIIIIFMISLQNLRSKASGLVSRLERSAVYTHNGVYAKFLLLCSKVCQVHMRHGQ